MDICGPLSKALILNASPRWRLSILINQNLNLLMSKILINQTHYKYLRSIKQSANSQFITSKPN